MDDHNKKDSFDDFFKNRSSDEELGKKEEKAAAEPAKPSYYYSYGPFKSTEGDNGREVPRQSGSDMYTPAARVESELVASENVEITPPKAVADYAANAPAPNSGWQFKKEPRRRSTFRAMFASFLAGVIVVGVLMFASDHYNWFSTAQALAPAAGGNEAAQVKDSSGGSSVSNAVDVERPNNIPTIFKEASPAVVKIETFVKGNNGSGSGSVFDNDPFFRQFFGDQGGDSGQSDNGSGSDQLVPNGLGSGFLFEKDGYILTNQHVVEGADKVSVTVQGYDKPFDAKVLGQSYELDLAVVKIEGSGFPTLSLGNSDSINIGEWVVAIGNPNGFEHTVTVGVLSAKERPISIPDQQGTRNYEHLLQTDASINPGNSGGPLINMQGEVIGINTAVSTDSQGIGFAIPSSTIKDVVDTLKANKSIPKKPAPFIGATLSDITDDIASQLGLTNKDGAIVANILYKSPAYNADLRQYDVITGLDGTKYKTKEELIAAIQKKSVGDKVTLNVLRNGKTVDLTVDIGDKNSFNVQ